MRINKPKNRPLARPSAIYVLATTNWTGKSRSICSLLWVNRRKIEWRSRSSQQAIAQTKQQKTSCDNSRNRHKTNKLPNLSCCAKGQNTTLQTEKTPKNLATQPKTKPETDHNRKKRCWLWKNVTWSSNSDLRVATKKYIVNQNWRSIPKNQTVKIEWS